MSKSQTEIYYLRSEINRRLLDENKSRLTIECRKYKIPSVYAIDILKYIYPQIRQTTLIPKVVVEWISNEYLLDEQLKRKNLEKIPTELQSQYKKYRVGREIKIK